ncbi:MAG: methyltransferase [Candidatus Methanomethylicia archaeon]|jgi:16S rRNA (guanine1207-N2)-methyltransferase|nr:methyltransferase [Candidatus Methanomethylicia archaeon]MCQ5373876.1 methyltransferase [Candidatus Methanomethylicia archaeon]
MYKNEPLSSHYFTKPNTKKPKKYNLRFDFKGHTISLVSGSGVFSKDHVDLGTLVLLESVSLPDEGEVLDMGCGYGALGIAIAKSRPKLKVTMVDINPLAVKLARENIEINQVYNATALRSDLYSQLEGKKFDIIFSNPPLAAGYKTIFPMIEGAKAFLKEGGSLVLVLRKGTNAIPQKMREVFNNVALISRKSGYKVFLSIKTTNQPKTP